MKIGVTVVTLGVKNIPNARRFYETLFGWEVSKASQDDVVFFKMAGSVLALFPRKNLAEDAGVSGLGNGFSGITLAHNVAQKEKVSRVLARVAELGGKVVKPAQDAFWGGHHGYFADPDGHLWEVAWNPHFAFKDDGTLELP